MGTSRVQTRVNDELKDRIEKYQEEGNYINQAEAVRALLRDGLEANESDELEKSIDKQAAETVRTDGGGIARPILREAAGMSLITGLLSIFGAFAVGSTIVFGINLLVFALSAFILGAVTTLPLLTPVPEQVDHALWNYSRRLRGRDTA